MTTRVNQPETYEVESEYEHELREAPPGLVDSGLLFARSAQLTCEGALSLLVNTSPRDLWARLVRLGLEWEDEVTGASEHRSR